MTKSFFLIFFSPFHIIRNPKKANRFITLDYMYIIHRFDTFSEKKISEYNICNLIMVNSDYYCRNTEIKSNPVTGDLENHKKR